MRAGVLRHRRKTPRGRIWAWVCAGAFLAALPALFGCTTETRVFRIGYMICNSLSETRGRFDALTASLSETTGARFDAVYLDTSDVEDAFSRGEIDFAHTNSLLYITLRQRHGAIVVAAEKRGTYGVRTRGVFVVRKDSGLQGLADLKGKRVVFGPQWAPFGFLAQYALLLDAGIDPETDLGYYAIPAGSWKHEKVIYSVLHGEFDAGASPLMDLEEMIAEGRISKDNLEVLAASELAPYCTVSASPRVPGEWVEKTRRALLAITPQTTAEAGGERLLVLKRALVDGFEPISDSEYDPMRQWARTAKMPPFQEF